ncbi:MAG: glycosyltransferase [Methylococcales bacterium]|nr:glycosyltransferase [Methylococcales bacterium]
MNENNEPLTQKPKIIVLHDYFAIRGGGERLILDLCEGLNADLCTGYWTNDSYPQPTGLKIRVLSDKVPASPKMLSMKKLFTHHTDFLNEYDICIYSGQSSIYAIEKHKQGRNIYYCHTPPRYIFDQRAFYRSQFSWWLHPFFEILMLYLGLSYKRCIRHMDKILANSNNIKGRLLKYTGIDSRIVYPPIDIKGFHWLSQGDYYLSNARLDPLKRIDKIIEAFTLLPDKKLVVVSGGSEEAKLREMAQNYSNIHITGWQSDEQIRHWVGNAIATIYIPVDEDFGMAPVESMAAGKPVIGVADGGLLETLQHGKTGLLLPKQLLITDIVDAVKFMDKDAALAMREACEKSAKRFSREIFIQGINEVLHSFT